MQTVHQARFVQKRRRGRQSAGLVPYLPKSLKVGLTEARVPDAIAYAPGALHRQVDCLKICIERKLG